LDLDYGRAWTAFIPPVDTIVHHFKYGKKTRLAQMLGQAMAAIIKSDFYLRQADTLVPIPLFWWKQLRRGYNQAALLAQVISQETGLHVVPALGRIKNTRTQTKLSEAVRRDNVYNAFRVNRADVKDQIIILIDDVLTTGATMNECARILKDAGAKQVYACVAAITPGP
jgi:ComF family protein